MVLFEKNIHAGDVTKCWLDEPKFEFLEFRKFQIQMIQKFPLRRKPKFGRVSEHLPIKKNSLNIMKLLDIWERVLKFSFSKLSVMRQKNPKFMLYASVCRIKNYVGKRDWEENQIDATSYGNFHKLCTIFRRAQNWRLKTTSSFISTF